MKRVCFIYFTFMLLVSCSKNKPNLSIESTGILSDYVHIKATNLEPGNTYKLYLQLRSVSQPHSVWLAHATYIANEHGEIDVSKDKSIAGSYTGLDSIGLFYTMKLTDTKPSFLSTFKEALDKENFQYILQVVENDRNLASEAFTLKTISKNIETFSFEDDLLKFNAYKANDKNELVVILGGSEGDNYASSSLAKLIASKNHNTVALSYFSGAKQYKNLLKIPLEIIDSSLHELKKMSFDFDSISIIGASKGAEMALLYASLNATVKNAICFAPSSTVFQGIGGKFSSWTYNGNDVPFAPFYYGKTSLDNNGKRTFLDAYSNSLKNAPESSLIKAQNIKGDIYLFSGTDDIMLPASIMADTIEAICERNDFKYTIENIQYKDAGHFISPPACQPESFFEDTSYVVGGTTKANAYAKFETWLKLCEILEK